MNYRKQFIRALFFVFLLACLLTGLAGIMRAPAQAAPQMQAATLSVVINEIAWAGTLANANHEWIELYNPGASDINLSGWTLQAVDGTPSIALSGTIVAGGYYLLERNQAATDIPADLTYSGVLSNSVETLELRDATNTIVDTANQGGGSWFAGSAVPNYYSMERIDIVADSPTVWASNNGVNRNGLDANSSPINGTPKQPNSATLALTATISPTASATSAPAGTAAPPRSLLINEVAWAGTAATLTSDEWIELYNPGSGPIDLTGWVLKADDGSPNIALSGSIPAGGYFLLERTDDTTVLDIPADLIYTGDLGNSNEILVLEDPNGNLVDTANSNGGAWPAGTNTTTFNSTAFGTMERRPGMADSDIAWITNTGAVANGVAANGVLLKGTPKNRNWAVQVTPTISRTPTRTRTPSRTPTITRTPTPLPPPPLLVINEFVPRPGHDWNGDGEVNVGDEYIEILNHGVVDVNLSGHTLDDEVNIGSVPYRLPSVVLGPGERIVFFGSETGLLLSDGGDGVRLLKPNGQLFDAYNYTVVRFPDHTYCRYPDNGGADDWNTNCFPTPGLQNSLSGEAVPPPEESPRVSACPFSDLLPEDFAFILAECRPFGQNIFRPAYWDRTGWYGERYLPESPGKWPVFVD